VRGGAGTGRCLNCGAVAVMATRCPSPVHKTQKIDLSPVKKTIRKRGIVSSVGAGPKKRRRKKRKEKTNS